MFTSLLYSTTGAYFFYFQQSMDMKTASLGFLLTNYATCMMITVTSGLMNELKMVQFAGETHEERRHARRDLAMPSGLQKCLNTLTNSIDDDFRDITCPLNQVPTLCMFLLASSKVSDTTMMALTCSPFVGGAITSVIIAAMGGNNAGMLKAITVSLVKISTLIVSYGAMAWFLKSEYF